MCRLIAHHLSTGVSTVSQVPKVCIIGSGPAGFYTAQQILKVGSLFGVISLLDINSLSIDFSVLYPLSKWCVTVFSTGISYYGHGCLRKPIQIWLSNAAN